MEKALNTKSVPILAHFWCLVSCRIEQTRRVGSPLPIALNKVKETRRGGFTPSSRRIKPVDTMEREDPLHRVQ